MPKRDLSKLVLDTIDTISARKNRPNFSRIFRHLHRLYDLSLHDCEELINTLLVEGKVIKVTYKGQVSYRNAFKWKKRLYEKKAMGTELPGALLLNAISELVVQEPDYLNIGVPYHILEEHLLSMDDSKINKETINKLLQRELKLESLLQYENGNVFISPKSPDSPVKIESDNEEKNNFRGFSRCMSSEAFNVITIKESESFSNINQEYSKDNHLSNKEDKTVYKVANNNNVTKEKVINFEKVIPHKELKPKETSEIYFGKNSSVHIIQASHNTNNRLNGFVEKLSYSKMSDCGAVTLKLDSDTRESKSPLIKKNGLKVSKSPIKEVNHPPNSEEIDDVNQIDLNDSCRNKDHIDPVDVSTIIGVDNRELGEKKTSSSITVNNDNKGKKNDSPGKECENNEKVSDSSNSLILQRARRKLKTKYDASDYYFPSLKRKSRDTDTDKKDEKRKKKKKKENCPTNLSGLFAKRYMFPGNTSMCSECQCYGSKVKSDPMISCSSCSNVGHQSCVVKMMDGKKWLCKACRKDAELCRICERRSQEKDREALFKCNHCGDHYHKGCHNPAIKLPFLTSWNCYRCPPVEEQTVQNVIGKERSHKPLKDYSVIRKKTFGQRDKTYLSSMSYFEDNPPDSSTWTADDVFNYFKKYFDEEVANELYEQDLDGPSLKLMEREDVFNLNFSLGLRLKILMHVKRLQLRTNDLCCIWRR